MRARIAITAGLISTLGLAPWPVMAQAVGKVIEYGIYGEDHVLVKQTRNIPSGKPVRFGFCFETRINAKDGATTFIETLRHPLVIQSNGIETNGYSMPRMFELKNGVAKGCSGYLAKNPDQLRAGIWRFTLSDAGKDVVIQEFVVK